MAHSPTYFSLLEACSQPGCPVCRLVNDGVKSYLDSFFYEGVNDVAMREHLRSSLGYCRDHLRFMLEAHIGDPLAYSIIYQDVIGNVLKAMPEEGAASMGDKLSYSLRKATGGQPRRAAESVERLSPAGPCPVCQEQASVEKVVLQTLVKSVHEIELETALAGSPGLCVPHLRRALESAGDRQAFDALTQITRQSLDALRAELAEFIRKNDYRFAAEPVGTEGDAWRRAVVRVAGL